MRRLLFLLFAVLMLGPPGWSQSLAKTFTFTANGQTKCIGTNNLPTVGITITGTSTLTFQPEVSINGGTPQDSQVTPTTCATAPCSPQNTISTSGSTNAAYIAPVGGFDSFCLNVSSYSSGTATVTLNPSSASFWL